MGNTRWTCEEKNFKKCEQPKRSFVNNGFTGTLCLTCWGVVSHERIEVPVEEKPKRISKTSKTKAIDSVVEEAKTVVEEVNVVEETTVKAPEPTTEVDSELFAVNLLKQEIQMVDILVALKKEFGMTNREASLLMKKLKAEKEPEQEEVIPEPVKEEPVMIASPLPEKEAQERAESPIKPPVLEVRTVKETTSAFPIIKFELVEETLSYRMSLVTEDGLEFVFEITPDPEKYARAKANPSLFDNLKIQLTYTELDSMDCPVNPKFAGVTK